MADYSESSKTYWDKAIADDDKYTSVGVRSLPESINRKRKEQLLGLVRKIGIEHLGGFENASVLDAGCGTGIYTELYTDLGAFVTGVDISDNAISLLNESDIQGEFHQASLDDLPFGDDEFDLTHSFSVLYHVVDDIEWMESVAELVRVTRPSGLIILRIAWQDHTEHAADHVKRRSKNKYLSALARNHECRLEAVYPFADIPYYERVLKTLHRFGLTRAQDALANWIIQTDRFKIHPTQRVVVFRV